MRSLLARIPLRVSVAVERMYVVGAGVLFLPPCVEYGLFETVYFPWCLSLNIGLGVVNLAVGITGREVRVSYALDESEIERLFDREIV